MPGNKIIGDFPDDPERGFDWAVRLERIVTYRAQGLGATKIVERLRDEHNERVSVDYVNQMLREYTEKVRDDLVQLGQTRFAEHDARCEYLYSMIQEKLLNDKLCNKQFSALVIAAVRILERQARLHGIDRQAQGAGGGQRNAWLEHATPEELARIAKKYGLPVPARFELTAN